MRKLQGGETGNSGGACIEPRPLGPSVTLPRGRKWPLICSRSTRWWGLNATFKLLCSPSQLLLGRVTKVFLTR